VPTIVSLSVVSKIPFAERIAEIDKNIAREFLQGCELTNASVDGESTSWRRRRSSLQETM
jgi:hypothetical protein